MRCPHCRTENPPAAQRCSSCGATLNDQPNAERKLVTVLYADLVGHTEIETRTDPEEWRTLLQAYFGEMAKPIQRYGGTVEKFIGDAIFAVFGVPQTHEDDAERAVRAAEEMQSARVRLSPLFTRRLGVPLGLRIALVTGEAVAPRELKQDQFVTGELTSLAERLQKEAPPNSIVLSDRTYQLVVPLVEVESLGDLPVRGFPTQQRAFLLRRVRHGVHRPWAVEVGSPLIGRERELRELVAARDRLMAGQGQVVLIIGEAGLGKSRLVGELRARLEMGIEFLEARCQEFAQATTYGVVAQHLRGYLELADADPPEIGRVQLDAALSRAFGRPVPEVQQALEHLLGLEVAHYFEEATRGLGPEEVRTLIVRAITAFWEAIGGNGPLVLMVEDLQWVDAASAVVLAEIPQIMERVPLMLLSTFRPERRSLAWEFKIVAERDHPHRYHEVRLGPLSTAETEHLAHLLLEKLGLPTELKGTVAQRAEGNPFYVEEVVKSLPREGEPSTSLPLLPDTLRGVLLARLDRLSAPTRKLLQTASVIGRMFPLGLLQAVSGAERDLASHLSVLQRTDFVYEEQRIPEPQFAFRHILLQEAAYQTLLRPERQEIHRRVAEALEREPAAIKTLPLLAHHFVQGEVWEKAFAYAVQAGDAARALSALEDALEHYDVALRIARDHPECMPDESLLLNTQKARGDLLIFLGRYQEARQTFEEMLAQHRAPKVRAQIYRGIGELSILSGNLAEAQTNLEQALRLFEQDRDHEGEAWAYRNLAYLMERRRDYPKALEYAHRALAIVEGHHLSAQEVYRVLTSTHFYGGDISAAARYAEEALHLAVRENNQLAIGWCRNNLANIRLFTGDVQEATTQARQAIELATRLRLGRLLVICKITLGEIFLEQARWQDAAEVFEALADPVHRLAYAAGRQGAFYLGRGFVALLQSLWNEAIQHFEEAESVEKRAQTARNLPRIRRGLAEAALGLGDLDRAETAARTVIALERGGNSIDTPGALRVLAVIARDRGDVQRAVNLLQESCALTEIRKGSGEYGRTLLELAKTYAAGGRTREAKDAAEESVRVFKGLQASTLVDGAQHVLAQL